MASTVVTLPDDIEFPRDKCHEWEPWLLKAIRSFRGMATQSQISDWLKKQDGFPSKGIPTIVNTTYQQLGFLVERGIISVDTYARPQIYCLNDKSER